MIDWKVQADKERPYHLRVHLEMCHGLCFEGTRGLSESELVALITKLEATDLEAALAAVGTSDIPIPEVDKVNYGLEAEAASRLLEESEESYRL